MSVSAGMAAVAASNAAITSSAARRAREETCKAVVENYDPAGASTEMMKDYSISYYYILTR
jgi:3-hydroxyisobutyrate dehydrogenase-like beta-hydroxyacid dehydrogenase